MEAETDEQRRRLILAGDAKPEPVGRTNCTGRGGATNGRHQDRLFEDGVSAMIRAQRASLAKIAVFWLSLSATPIAHPQQAEPSFPDGGQGPAATIALCVPADLVERGAFEQPAPGSKMDAFHNALRYFLLDHGDVRLQYRVKQDAFESFDPANVDPRKLLDEASATAHCPEADYSYSIPTKRVSQSATQNTPQSTAQGPAASDLLYRGWQYQVGKGVPKDPAMAAKLYADAANQGFTEAMYRLALLYSDGNGVTQDSAAAVNWFYQAAKRGHAAAQMELGFAFASGNGVRHDDQAGFHWMQLAAQSGLPQAQGALGAMYEVGEGVTQNESEAAVWFRKSAEQGQIMGMFELAQSLRMGRGITRNEGEAMQWYEKSAKGGYVPAQAQLGYCYLVCSGAAPDYQLAAFWLTEAARQGDSYAQLNLGTLYEDGHGVDRDLEQARTLYTRAAGSSVPQVAQRARELAAALPDASGERTLAHPAPSSTASAILGLAAVAVVGATLIHFMSRSGSEDAAPPSGGGGPNGIADMQRLDRENSNANCVTNGGTPGIAGTCH